MGLAGCVGTSVLGDDTVRVEVWVLVLVCWWRWCMCDGTVGVYWLVLFGLWLLIGLGWLLVGCVSVAV